MSKLSRITPPAESRNGQKPKTCLCFPKAALMDKILHGSTNHWPLRIMQIVRTQSLIIFGINRLRCVKVDLAGRRQHDDGRSDLSMNIVVKRTLTAVSQIPSESVQLRELLGNSKIVAVLACQSLQRHGGRLRLTARYRANHIV